MHHSCPKCGGIVENTQPFCGHCRAPQIRMSSSDDPANANSVPPEEYLPPVPQAAPNFASAEPAQQFRGVVEPQPMITAKAPIPWGYTLPRLGVIGLGTTICFFLIPIPIVNLVFIPAGCFLAVWLQSRKTVPVLPATGQGAILGFITSFFSFIFFAIIM